MSHHVNHDIHVQCVLLEGAEILINIDICSLILCYIILDYLLFALKLIFYLKGAGKLESNKTTPDSIIVEYANSESNDENVNATFNCVFLKMIANNKYWSIVDGNIVVCDASSSTCAQQWQLELRNGTCLAIRTFESRSYLNLNNNGTITVSSSGPDNATLWEF